MELFGTYTALLVNYYKTPEHAEIYFDFSMLPHNQPDAATKADSGATQA